jgi:hypothetical protein
MSQPIPIVNYLLLDRDEPRLEATVCAVHVLERSAP